MSALTLSAQAGWFAGFGAIVMWLFGILVTVFWIWMLIDCLTSSMPANEKILWFLVIFFLPLIGSLIYYFTHRPSGPRRMIT
jgi:hypothetical protein